MKRAIACLILLGAIVAVPLHAQEPLPLGKGIDIGPLGEYFTVLTAETSTLGGGYTITLKLQAKKDVDTSDLFVQLAAFDKGKLLLESQTLKFDADLSLLKGESLYAGCRFLRFAPQAEGLPWHRLSVRNAKKPKQLSP
jgi:hypothetical protein